MNKQDGGPAFPCMERVEEWREDLGKYVPTNTLRGGMSLRDHFAGQALIGLASSTFNDAEQVEAALAYKLADAMIAERSKP